MAIKKLDSRMVQVPATIEQINSVSLSTDTIYSNNVNVFNGLTVFGTISALSGYEIIVSETSQTSALDISNIAPIPALTVSQGIASPVVATFSHDGNEIVIINNNGIQTDSVTAPTVTAGYIRTADLYFEQGGGVVSNAAVFGNLTVYGTLSALSGTVVVQTVSTETSSLSVRGTGTGVALGVSQAGIEPIAEFYGGNGIKVLSILNSLGNTGPYVTVSGPVSALGGDSTNWNTAFNRSTVFSSVSGRYNNTSTVVESNSANWNNALNIGTAYAAASASYPRKFATNIGNGSLTAFEVTHSLETRDVMTQVYDNTTYEVVLPSISNLTTNTVGLSFDTPPGTNAFRVVVIG